MRGNSRFLAALSFVIAMFMVLGHASTPAWGDDSNRVYVSVGEIVDGGILDDDGILHTYFTDEHTLGPNGWSPLALFVEGTRFSVISEGGDGTGGVPAYARIIIVLHPTGQ
jgi:hypothetical protein